MDFKSRKGRLILRQVRYQLALAKRHGHLVNVADIASRLARKYHRSTKTTVEISDAITILAAKAGLPVYLSRCDRPKRHSPLEPSSVAAWRDPEGSQTDKLAPALD
jgi:hypothetical protein